MEQIPKSGYYNTNKFARIALKAYEDVMGKNGLNAILNMVGLSNLIDNYPILLITLPSIWVWKRCTALAADAGWLCGPDAPPSMMC
jgi:hypothetical protein